MFSSYYSYSTQKHQQTEAKLDDPRQNEKEKGQCSIHREQNKPEKGKCSARQDKTKKKKTNITEEWKWEYKKKPMTKKECTLEAEVLVDLDHDSTPFNIFQTVIGMNELL